MYSEEQQPLEDFFRAKNLKVRNEMAEDVSVKRPVILRLYTRLTRHSPRYWQQHSRIKSWIPQTMKLCKRRVGVLMRTARVRTKTSRSRRNPTLQKNLTPPMKAVEMKVAMQRLQTQMQAATQRRRRPARRMRRRRNGQRRKSGRRNDADDGTSVGDGWEPWCKLVVSSWLGVNKFARGSPRFSR